MKSNKKMMILSFLGIVIVVLGHTKYPIHLMSNFFPYYSFHMALFIFISGYFYKTENENNLFGKKGYFLRKIKKMLIPYFLWNIFYGVIVNILKLYNIVEYGEKINIHSLFIRPWTDGTQYHLNIASWFLLSLFLVNILYVIIRKLSKKIWNDHIALIVLLALSILSIKLSNNNITKNSFILFALNRTFFFMLFYHFAYYYKKYVESKINISSGKFLFIIVLIQLIILKFDGKIDYLSICMSFSTKYSITPILSSLTGILFWLKISELLVPILKDNRIVIDISNNTYSIMMHHILWIFIINFLIYNLSAGLNLTGFNINEFKKTVYYIYTPGISQISILYFLIALFMPVYTKKLFTRVLNNIKMYKSKLNNRRANHYEKN